MLTFAILRNRMQQKTNKTHWYLLYTKPRAEKKAALELQKKGYEVFLPLQKTLKVWSDRKKWVEEPLFNSYIFIETELEPNYYTILNAPGIVKFISFQSHPAIVDPRDIQLVKLLLGSQGELITTNSLGGDGYDEAVKSRPWVKGESVTIIAGPLIGTTGTLIATRSGNKMLIELQSIQQNILITIPQNFISKEKGHKLQTV
jgi:transcription antitermination factor NusG